MNRKLLYILLAFAIGIINGCSPNDRHEHLEREYRLFKEILNHLASIHKDDKSSTINYLDSMNLHSENLEVRLFLNIKKIQTLKGKKTEYYDFLKKYNSSEDYDRFYPFFKYYIKKSIALHQIQELNSHLEGINNYMTALSYIEPYEEIFSEEICTAYLNIAAMRAIYFNDSSSGYRTLLTGQELSKKYGHTYLAIKFGTNLNSYYFKSEEFENVVANSYKLVKYFENNPKSINNQIRVYSDLRIAYANLGRMDSIPILDSLCDSLYESNRSVASGYYMHLLCAMENDIKRGDTLLIKHYPILESNFIKKDHLELFQLSHLYTIMLNYSYIIKDFSKQEKYLELLSEVVRLGSTNRFSNYSFIKETLQKIKTQNFGTKYSQFRSSCTNLIEYIDAKMISQLEKSTKSANLQLSYWFERDLEKAKEIHQEKISKIWTRIALSFLLLTIAFVIYFLYKKIISSKKIITNQKIDLKTIVNIIPIGLGKINNKSKVVWANNSIIDYFEKTPEFREGIFLEDIIGNSICKTIIDAISKEKDAQTISYNVALTAQNIVKSNFKRGMKWLKIIIISTPDIENESSDYIIAIEDQTKEKLQEWSYREQKEKYENDLKIKLDILSNNIRILNEIAVIIRKDPSIYKDTKNKILKKIDNKNNKRILEEIDLEFINTEKDFYSRISKHCPGMSLRNLKLCSYIMMNLSSKEIASLMFIERGSVNVAISRLRKKFNIQNDSITLYNYFNSEAFLLD